jgi:hypothetical protein
VDDWCGATLPAAQKAALLRMVQAGAVRLTTIAALLEWQRDWENRKHYDKLMSLLEPQAGSYGFGMEYAYTMCGFCAAAGSEAAHRAEEVGALTQWSAGFSPVQRAHAF